MRKPRIDLQVSQVPGYYRIDLRIYIGDKLTRVKEGVDLASQVCPALADEIRENFEVTEVKPGPSNCVLIKCLRPELRKIETWLTLQGYNIVPLKRWKNERS